MGCYETITVPCPKCQEPYYAQSKSGPCAMLDYKLEDAPDEVIAGVNRHAPFTCEKCGTVFCVELEYPENPILQIRRRVVLA